MSVGLVGFVAGSLALGLQLVGFVSAADAGASLPVLLGSSAIATLVATVSALRHGQNAVAAVFGVFTGFWTSYVLLVISLLHSWLVVPTADLAHTQALFVLTWLILIAVLTLGSLRLPSSFTLVLALVDIALILQLIGILSPSSTALKWSGVSALGFAAVGAYLFLDAVNQAGGGKPLPLGRPILRPPEVVSVPQVNLSAGS